MRRQSVFPVAMVFGSVRTCGRLANHFAARVFKSIMVNRCCSRFFTAVIFQSIVAVHAARASPFCFGI
jgi:hypothetical protein